VQIDAILFEPVGTLAEFPAAPFQAIASRLFGRPADSAASASQIYWNLIDALAASDRPFAADERAVLAAGELEAVERAELYEDAAPALAELVNLGVKLIVASSLSEIAIARFIDRVGLSPFFHDCWSRGVAAGVGDVVLRRAVASSALDAGRVLFLADTEAGVRAATRADVRPILMMNDPDEAMRLTALEPAGGVVSLLELPDLVRLAAARRR